LTVNTGYKDSFWSRVIYCHKNPLSSILFYTIPHVRFEHRTTPLNCGWTNYERAIMKFIDPRATTATTATNEASRPPETLHRKYTQQLLREDESHERVRASKLFAQTTDLLTTDATTSGEPESFLLPMQRRRCRRRHGILSRWIRADAAITSTTTASFVPTKKSRWRISKFEPDRTRRLYQRELIGEVSFDRSQSRDWLWDPTGFRSFFESLRLRTHWSARVYWATDFKTS